MLAAESSSGRAKDLIIVNGRNVCRRTSSGRSKPGAS
jgi:hypothetical protein